MTKDFIAHKRKATKGFPCESQSLKDHLHGVGELASGFAQKIDFEDIGRLLGLLHDFGKYSLAFQNYIASAVGDLDVDDADFVNAAAMKGKIDHSSAGAQFIWSQFSGTGSIRQGDIVGQIMALCIASHHSGLIDCFGKNNVPKFSKRMDKLDEFTHLEECCGAADKEIVSAIDKLATRETCGEAYKKLVAFTGGKLPFSKIDYFNLGFLTRFLFSALIDADRLNSAEFETPQRKQDRLAREGYFNWDDAIERLENHLAGLSQKHRIDEFRKNISDNCFAKAKQPQGIYTLTVPTGGGKTYASLRYALHHAAHHDLDRIIYIIPYTSIIEQNALAIREVIEREGDKFPWVLEHHSNLEVERQTWQSKLISENWDSPIILTTMVQFLETCFAGGTRGVRRLHQLANSVIVFDEIQTLPVNCTHLFCNVLNFLTEHCKTTAMLCTATQPLLDELPTEIVGKGQLKIPKENEIVTNVGQLFDDLNRVEVVNETKPKGWTCEEIVALAMDQFEQQGSCLIIVNTKAWAKKLYQNCQQKTNPRCVFHLSTNQCPAHRKSLLDEIKFQLESDLPVLCISTQLIEAGVDISFASVIRFLAGLDSIAQAAGRCNRHGEGKDESGEPDRGKVFVVNPDNETTQLLVDIEAGKEAAARVLQDDFENLVAPEAISRYFQYYFYERKDAMDYQLDERSMGRSDTLLNLLTDNCNAAQSFRSRERKNLFPMLSQAFMEAGKQFKAIDAPTQAVIVPYGDGVEIITSLCAVDREFDAAHYYKLLRRAQQYSVNVFPNDWKKLLEVKAVYEVQEGFGVFCLGKCHYSKEFGLSVEPISLMEDYQV